MKGKSHSNNSQSRSLAISKIASNALLLLVFLPLIAILGLFIWYCQASCDEYDSPVYQGSLRTFKCKLVGPCQEIRAEDSEFRFAIQWREGRRLFVGLEEEHLPDGLSKISLETARIQVLKSDVGAIQTQELKDLILWTHEDGVPNEGILKPTGIELKDGLKEDEVLGLTLAFSFTAGGRVTHVRFHGEFTLGKLKACYPLV